MMMTKTTINEDDLAIIRLNKCLSQSLALFDPPKQITVSQWAAENRILSDNAEAGPWRNERTPYLVQPMDSFSDYRVNRIILVACSQAGKSELILNIIGYIIDNDPAVVMLVEPTIGQMKRFSKLRVSPLLRNTRCIRKKIKNYNKTAKGNNTVLEKAFPGGTLIMIGTNSAGDLASTPVKVVLGDERDRHSKGIKNEGDPWELVKARQITFRKEAKNVEVSSPTVKGDSPIVASFEEGTQCFWYHQCPECGEWHEILFKDIRFTYTKTESANKRTPTYKVKVIGWACPSCGSISSERVMKKQPQKWIANNPEAYNEGVVSFWIKGFANGFADWNNICLAFLQAKDDTVKLQAFTNTVLGELWEDRGTLNSDEEMMQRREKYEAELPDGVLCLTCGVDTQDDRLEYEIVGYGRFKENWGIKKGYIIGRPSEEETWKQLDDVIDKVYKFKNGKGLKISITLVDSGGHYTKEVYHQCYKRSQKHVFAIKGKGGDYPFTTVPTKIKINYENKVAYSYLFTLGVDAGKSQLMAGLKVETSGPHFSHFPSNMECGYDEKYFSGLLSERPVWKGTHWKWELLPGHKRNEPLDCRNYANAGVQILNPNFEAIEQRLKGISIKEINSSEVVNSSPQQAKRRFKKPSDDYYDTY